ncbi:hypothetical protein SEUBUCD646_0N02770 [Saccharomyces eubayanus]|uniref:Phosphatidylinositol N-acetylglucosaminyltransferase subunit H conserved domain-containing protein n=1 Tax=Saccharomyces eubayanus TaxID=1080349 RepID=A0ABN8VIH5_SACEU|nr:hypothetical protein SEUBUCD650_0N02760 [Saccharomyces eubayanus]CAI1721118.1 hypothetical protein SEUBUCD646_0N02770 [Saccharomyces eubayanus]
MISEEYEFGKVSILNRRKYTLIIDEDTNGSFIRFTVLPESSLKLRKSKRNERVEVKMGVQYHRIALILLSNVVFYGICVGTRLLEYISEIFGLRTWTNCQTIIIMGLFALCTVMFVREPSVETVTIFKGTGLQLSKVNGIVVFPQKWNRRLFERVEFISNDRIIDVVINEGFYRGFQVIFYLAAIVRNASNLPNIDDQRLIYNISRKYLNERTKPLHRPKD